MVNAYLSYLYSRKELTIADVLELEKLQVFQMIIDKYYNQMVIK